MREGRGKWCAVAVRVNELRTNPFAREIRVLIQTALVIFIYTVAVGILNGIDLVDIDHPRLMAHVHGGTIGWLTLGTFAASLWLFGDASMSEGAARWGHRLAYASAIGVAAYVLAFLFTVGYVRPVVGTAVTLVFFAFLAWVAVRARSVQLTVPHLGILAAVATSGVGAVMGVLLGIQIASGREIFAGRVADAHPATMVIGFLVPVGMAIGEWALRADHGLPAAGRVGRLQIALLFIGWLLVLFGTLLDAVVLLVLTLPFEVVGVGIYIWRVAPALRRIDWRGGAYERYCPFSVAFLVVNMGLLVYLLGNYADDFEAAPMGALLALDHMIFVGVLTNALFALVTVASRGRRAVWAWADVVMLAGINVGLAGFTVGLIAESAPLKQLFTPIMGGAILLGIATFSMRLQGGEQPARVRAPAR